MVFKDAAFGRVGGEGTRTFRILVLLGDIGVCEENAEMTRDNINI